MNVNSTSVDEPANATEPDGWRAALADGFELGKRYQLLADHLGQRGIAGSQYRQRPGSSMEFFEHRDYQPGDDLRHIDWSVMAKRDQVYIKCFEQESTPLLDIVLDDSVSMNLAGTSKAVGTLKLLSALYSLAKNSGFHIKLWLAGGGGTFPQGGCNELRLAGIHPQAWPLPQFGSTQNLSSAFQERTPSFRPRGTRILISDLLFDADPQLVIQQFSRGAQSSLIIQLLAEADTSPPKLGSLKVVAAETGTWKTVFVDSDLQAKYRASFERHQNGWQEAASRQGCRFLPVIAEPVAHDNDLRVLEEHEIIAPTSQST